MPDLITVEQFRKELRAKHDPKAPVFRVSTVRSADVEGKPRTRRFIFSDGSVDRMGDTIDPDGWDLTSFTPNPVALWAHDSSAPSIGRASDVAVEGARLMGDITFADADTYPFADTIYRLIQGDFLNAVSVGFLPLEYVFVEGPERPWGIDFKRQELLEISVCPIPANPNALGAARAKGIDTRPLITWAEKLLDVGGGQAIVTRKELETLRKAAKEPSMTRRRTTPKAKAGTDDEPNDQPMGNCGRPASDDCGMKDPDECAVHAGAKSGDEPDDDDKPDEKRLRRLLRKLIRRSEDGDEPDGQVLAHQDAIRLAHKSLRTSKAYLADAVTHHTKAVNLLSDVVDALDGEDDDPKPEGKEEDDPEKKPDPDDDKAAQLRRAEEIRARHTPKT